MDHGIEALCSPAGTPLADEVVLAGIRILREGMLRTLQHLTIWRHGDCPNGSWLASFGLQARVPMEASHGIGHVLGGTFDVPHYYCTPVIMPSLLRYNKPFTEDAQKRLATALGGPGMEAADAFAEFTKRVGLPGRLADVCIGEDKFGKISKIAINHRFVQANPRPFKSEADIVDLLQMAA
jgi:maleylacetate reductase